MNIIYSIASEGMGHTIRSSVVIEHLIKSGHNVHIISACKPAKFLAKKFDHVLKITGMVIKYKDNKVSKLDTIITNAKSIAKLGKNIKLLSKLFKNFNPDLVITDFESAGHAFAKLHDVPVISIDNIQAINRCELDMVIKTNSYRIAKPIVQARSPKCNEYLITAFANYLPKKKNTGMFHPIIRPEVLAQKDNVTNGKHILIYQTASEATTKALNTELQVRGIKAYIYGADKGLKSFGNIVYKEFSEEEFIKDMISAKAVISGGSFTVMSECIYLGKPMLSIPIVGQFEQEMNGYYLEKMGYGKYCKLFKPEILTAFLSNIDFYKDNLKDYQHDDNVGLFTYLDNLIANIGA